MMKLELKPKTATTEPTCYGCGSKMIYYGGRYRCMNPNCGRTIPYNATVTDEGETTETEQKGR